MIKKEKDIELQVERLKEKEILRYEEMMAKNGGEVDARETSLQFMYALPKQKQGDDTNTVSINPSEQFNHGEEDSEVRMFKAKFSGKREGTTKDEYGNDEDPQVMNPQYADRRNKKDISKKERFPFLKNAPVEGDLAKASDGQMNHQPFNKVIYNVQCTRCGTWGHRSGDRECELKDFNPNDYSRLAREDPMSNFANDNGGENNGGSSSGSGGDTGSGYKRKVDEIDIDDGQDEEARFLNSLTSREKKLLIRKLKSKIVL